ncbi:helix-turn-helix transcriptional regulator [Bacillus sp. JJ1122]|uniref:helix-turn-helix transcriptional regulator n=1 Tax=Bacillus sp. JJ1122 TaxID=3122951 RepID=UPI0030001472
MKNNVKMARITANLTQQELADLVGITRQTISLIEIGKYNPSLKLCLQICYVVNKSLDELFWVGKGDFE